MTADLALIDPAQVVAAADDPATAVIALLDRATAWLVEATHIKDITKLRAGAEAVRVYTVQANLGRDAEQAACEMRLRAERRIGELLTKEVEHGGDRRSVSSSSRLNLKDEGITGNESSQFQKLAAIPKREFERKVSDLRDDQKLSRAALLADAKRSRAEQDEWVASITPKNYDPTNDNFRQRVRYAIRGVIEAVEKLSTTATPKQTSKALDDYFDHVSVPMRKDLRRAVTKLAKYEEV